MTMQLVQRDTLEGLAIPFGGPNRKDLQGEYFTPRTDLHLDWFPSDGRPTLYHHGLDAEVSGATIGRQISHEVKADGVWVEVQLAKRSKWVELIRQLLDRDGLGFSSGALPSLVKTVKATGEILSWPWVELSTTPTPASTDARITASKYLASLEEGGMAAALAARAEYERLEATLRATDPPSVSDERVKAIAAQAAKRYAETGDMAAAMDAIARAVRGGSVPIDPDTGLPVIRAHKSWCSGGHMLDWSCEVAIGV